MNHSATNGSEPAARPDLSVVMPAYNECEAIAAAVEDVRSHVLDHLEHAELIVVNDGSTDETGRIVERIAEIDPRVRVVHQENRGHGGALLSGLESAQGRCLLLVDSDRQIALDAFPRAWAEVENGRDGVFGVRRVRHDPTIRLQLARLVRLAIRAFFGARVSDANAPFKLFRRSIWEEARACVPRDTLAPSLFIAVFAAVRGFDVLEVDVAHRERATGEVSIRGLVLLRFCSRALRQMIGFRGAVRRVR